MSIHMPRNVIVIPRDVYQKCTDDFVVPRRKRNRGTARKPGWSRAPPSQGSSSSSSSKISQGRPNKNDLLATMPAVDPMLYTSASSPSLTSSLSSLSSSWSSSSSESPGRHGLPSFGNVGAKNGKLATTHNGVTITNNITTIHLRALIPAKKRKFSRDADAVLPNIQNTVAFENEDDKVLKRIKCDAQTQASIHLPCTSVTRVAMPVKAREIIEISSDTEDEDEVMDAGCAVKPILVPVTQASSTATAAEEFHKYELEPSLRRIIDTIFPEYEAHHQATLERAFATSRTLREKYVVTRYLGSGASGFVLAAKRVFDGLEVAIKVIPHTGDHIEGRVQRELNIMLKLKEHENILGCVEYFTSSLYGDVDPNDESNKDISYIVTQSAACSLFDFIELHRPAQDEDASTRFKNIKDFLHTIHHVSGSDKPAALVYDSGMKEATLHSIFSQLAKALHSMHSQCIVHGDIKDENALIRLDKANKTYKAILCDFGHSKYLAPGSGPTFPFYGTTVLAPPEMGPNMEIRQQQRKNKNSPDASNATTTRRQTRGRAAAANNHPTPPLEHFYGYEADVWALGLTLYTMVHGDLPKEMFEKDKKNMTYIPKRSSRGKAPKFHFTLQSNIDPDLKDLIQGMLDVDPAKRLSMNEVITHPWILNHQQP
ncbi:ATP-dependent Lon protease pim1 [Mortierella sp. GBA30]|nr:ATP-dependent Lon protease pim1 [Mortierella sp. GBA30]